VIVFLSFGVGDVLTTSVGLRIDGIIEFSPLMAPLLQQYGFAVLVIPKLVVIGSCYLLWRFLPTPYSVGVPLGLAVVGVAVTGWNLHVLAVAVMP